jgi:hypothetical protein
MPCGPRNSFLVEQVAQHAFELLLGEDRQEPPVPVTDEPRISRGYMGSKLRVALAKLSDQFHQPWIAR